MANPIFQGNHHKGYKGPGVSGTGIQNVTVEMGWGSVTGHSGDVCYAQLSSLVTGDINQGVFFQSECPVSVAYTLVNPGLAASLDPADQQAVMWTNEQAITANEIIEATCPVFTVMRITFGGSGTVYAATR
jgi:hypothetical protein